MSWIEQIKKDLIIQTGDGKEYRPHWMNASKSVEYNVAEFDFPNIEGTLVNRGTPRGSKYNIEFYFQGDNHLSDSRTFETSAKDKRAWTISHPFYGRIIVHPTSLTFDNTQLNVSKITGTIIETITEDFPNTTVAPVDKIDEDVTAVNETLSTAFENEAKDITASEINQLQANNNQLYDKGKGIADSEFAEDYFNAFNTANAEIATATSEPLAAARAIQAVIVAPARFATSVRNRLMVMSNQFDALHDTVSTALTKNLKSIFQNNGGSLISGMALAASTPQSDDYGNSNDVLTVIQTILGAYDDYLTDLDELQSDNGGNPDSFIPDANSIIQLNNLINFTVANLFNIAVNARQERSIYVEEDTNIIILAHRFYGLVADDNTINEILRTNNLGLNGILQVRKGTLIKYYI